MEESVWIDACDVRFPYICLVCCMFLCDACDAVLTIRPHSPAKMRGEEENEDLFREFRLTLQVRVWHIGCVDVYACVRVHECVM